MEIRPLARTIEDLLQGAFFLIPRFQREYAWEQENIEEFWTDLQSNSRTSYFIGSMTFFPDKTAGVLSVVDGQQRLTTITLFLCAIREHMRAFGFLDLSAALQNFISRKDKNGKDRYVLQTETSYPYFQEHIQRGEESTTKTEPGDEEERLKAAFALVKKFLGDEVASLITNSDAPTHKELEAVKTKLIDLRDRLLGLMVVSLSMDNEDDAYIVFETLNTRGKDLDVSDLVKNHVLRHLRNPNAVGDLPKEKWNKLARSFSTSLADVKLNEFFLHFWLSKYAYVAERNLFKQIKEKITKNTAKAFLDDIEKESELYLRIFEPGRFDWSKEQRSIMMSLRALTVFRLKQPIPMVLATLRSLSAKQITLAQAKRILSAIENFHFVFTAVTSQRSSGGISGMYSAAARDLDTAATAGDREVVIRELIDKLRKRVPSVEEFNANFAQIAYTRTFTRRKQLVDYILSKFQILAAGLDQFDQAVQSIEHIYPERPKGIPALPQDIVGQLGNLIWIPGALNSDLGNQDFAAKKNRLVDLKVPLDTCLKDSEVWDQSAIAERTKWMADVAITKIWKL